MRVNVNREDVIQIFKEGKHQQDVAVSLYKLIYPDWDKIQSVDGYPQTNKHTAMALFDMFTEFDLKHHPDVMRGGLWMNNGWGSIEGDDLKDWEVELAPVTYQ